MVFSWYSKGNIPIIQMIFKFVKFQSYFGVEYDWPWNIGKKSIEA